MLKPKFLLGLRRIGNAISLHGRFRLPQIVLRRCFSHARGTLHISDFDDDLAISVRLSETMQRRIFWMGYYNLDIVPVLRRSLLPGMTVIDIGANIGELSMIAAKLVGKTGHIIAFEPLDAIADVLQTNITRNRLDQVSIVRLGLSNVIKEHVPIYSTCVPGTPREENQGQGSLFSSSTSTDPLQHIALTKLDTWIDAHHLDRIDLIKIDIEGAELPCLQGAEQSLRRFKPMLIVEIQEQTAMAAGYHAGDVLAFLSTLGYSFRRLDRNGNAKPLVLEALKPLQNVLCLPDKTARATV